MNAVLNNNDLFNKIKSYMYYTEKQIKDFKISHYFFHQIKLNEDIRWLGFLLRDDVNLYDCYNNNDNIILIDNIYI